MTEGQHRDEILNALRKIREVCRTVDPDANGDKCALCPLYGRNGKCSVIFDIPATWKLADDPGPWRAIL